MNEAVEFLRKLGPSRLGAMIAVTFALVGFFAFVIMRVTQPEMGMLYNELSFQDSNTIIRDLDSRGVKYELRNEGQTILVPRADITRLRMEMAGKGLPSGGGVGYEIFDKGDAFSATSFVQGVNHLRALEGELARTIKAIGRVQQARVHLVIPERRLFERDRDGARASIVLKLAGELDAGQVRAIRHLVATAVSGLKPERISIVDERGRLLADGTQADGGVAAVMDDKQMGFERRLRTQVEEIVAGIVGSGRTRVQVAAELDMNRIESRSESFDPESRVVRSTQTRNETSTTGGNENGVTVGNELPGANPQQPAGAARDAANKNEEVINYEISRTTRTEVVEGGRVKRLSVAVLVDGIYSRGANGEQTYQPRTQEELDRIAALVRSAIGFDRNRGDQIEVVNLRFAEPPPVPEIKEPSLFAQLFSFTKDDVLRGAELAILGILSVIVLLTVVRPLVKRVIAPDSPARPFLAATLIGGAASGATAGAIAAQNNQAMQELANEEAAIRARESQAQRMLELVKVNGQVKAASVERLGEMVRNNPQETVAVLRTWIHDQA